MRSPPLRNSTVGFERRMAEQKGVINSVDSRVRVQLGPSPVDHEKTPMDKIDGSDLFKFKERICATFHIQYYPHLIFTYHALKS
ncbi:hypothetical protein MTR_3g095120 [Medicago truncatula]|uniref:Uncharacterized protein n=1 Tax=Medicago truncatula TaxID=3880 RepID=G7JAC5_MEDTR|nr:hypothetical protein MTR_3g095120 [Medicago truncatula]